MPDTKSIHGPVTSPSTQAQLRFNEDACSDKVSETGFDFFWSGGLLGALNNAVLVPKYRPIMIVNTDANIQYVALGKTSGLAAPATGAAGIPIPANGGRIVLSTGQNIYIRASSANVFGYLANDNVVEDLSETSI